MPKVIRDEVQVAKPKCWVKVWIKSVNYYDKRGRLIEVISQNNTSGIDKIKNTYDFEGKVLKSVLTKNYKNKQWLVTREYTC